MNANVKNKIKKLKKNCIKSDLSKLISYITVF